MMKKISNFSLLIPRYIARLVTAVETGHGWSDSSERPVWSGRALLLE